ncbi:hypothetical protein RclHR1_04170009 [Rhizophagus clarus]|uniref:Uncharacterized protein n=1 Tax=Rhizophagus clarus TaxID=94130 RepID=A0A2Z6RH17_9GLOM|nr:hypothetical protein RclHR1_04170009 [Rhizophagus clarus]
MPALTFFDICMLLSIYIRGSNEVEVCDVEPYDDAREKFSKCIQQEASLRYHILKSYIATPLTQILIIFSCSDQYIFMEGSTRELMTQIQICYVCQSNLVVVDT